MAAGQTAYPLNDLMNKTSAPILTLLLMALLAACSTNSSSNGPDLQAKTNAQITQAATTPLSDLNLVRADIPPVLAAAQKAPYALPADRGCPALASDVRSLDAALGADLDTPATESNPSLIDRGSNAVSDAAGNALKGAAESVIPFRGWVRKLSGAERYSREVAAAIAAGTIRRAYLKGLGQAAGCQAPSAPRV
jgi:hypothetical protein